MKLKHTTDFRELCGINLIERPCCDQKLSGMFENNEEDGKFDAHSKRGISDLDLNCVSIGFYLTKRCSRIVTWTPSSMRYREQ